MLFRGTRERFLTILKQVAHSGSLACCPSSCIVGGMSSAKGRDERVLGGAPAPLHVFKEMGSSVAFHNRGFPQITLELM